MSKKQQHEIVSQSESEQVQAAMEASGELAAPTSVTPDAVLATKVKSLERPSVNIGPKTFVDQGDQLASGRQVGRGIVAEQGQQFISGVAEGAEEAMAEVRQVTEDVIGEVQEKSGDYFRSIASQFSG